MSFQVTIKEVTVESVTKGKAKYQKAVVAYDFKGEAKTQSLVSFSNPDVFAKVVELNAGDVIEVTTTKNDAGYNQWAKIEKAGAAVAAPPAPGRSPGASGGGNWETAQERAENRARIVRQSTLSTAVASLGAGPHTSDAVINRAQEFFDWVYEAPDSDEAN
jgi:hypothetical protein